MFRTGPTFFFLVPVESRSEPKSSSSSSFGLFFRPRPTFPLLSLSSSSFSTSCLTNKLPSRRPLASDAVERLEDESRLQINMFFKIQITPSINTKTFLFGTLQKLSSLDTSHWIHLIRYKKIVLFIKKKEFTTSIRYIISGLKLQTWHLDTKR